MTTTQVISLKPRQWQADAYTLAAERARVTRNAWIVAWLNYAAGGTAHPRRRVIKPPADIGARTRETAAQLSVKAPASEDVAAWESAAALAVLSRQQWALCVLDAACGLSGLAQVLERVRLAKQAQGAGEG